MLKQEENEDAVYFLIVRAFAVKSRKSKSIEPYLHFLVLYFFV